ncbi:MAG: peptidoglycan DD-metalloendopeptidase family protein, partial [Sedimenticola sp.]|nr:peptidoglycan DD-metalloendopeptidase family protein [Sedimenticola sp.]
PNLLHRIVNSSKEAKDLANIRPGETIRVRLDKQGELLELVHKKSAIRSLQILPSEEGFIAQTHDRSLEKRVATTSGTIANSLYLAAQRAGLSDSLTMELANIFGWDIDFALEIRAGDQFSLIYEEEYLDGKKYRNGPILAAEFINQGKVFRAIRFEDDEGYSNYYSPEGDSMRKAFLRAPVDFRRISSRFTKARFHPVLGKKRPHKGVDYSAATGTPIKAAGDGRVIFRGTKGGYGRTVILRHGSQYTTLYGHLSKYRSGVNNGSRVRQGQVIGYVGKSGLATGPHLHYEFRVNGVHRNPLTIKLPAAEPLAKKYRSKFLSVSTPLIAQLDLAAKTMVADAR